jgi:hypothetical protein
MACYLSEAKVFENRVLRRIFGPKKVTGGWKKLHNEELHNLYLLIPWCRIFFEKLIYTESENDQWQLL